MKTSDIQKQNVDFLLSQTEALLYWARGKFVDKIFMTSSFGSNGTVLLDIIKKIIPDVPIYFIDTGFHFQETLEIKKYYENNGYCIKTLAAQTKDENQQLYTKGHDICCQIKKVEPVKKLLAGRKDHLWVTALSRDQTDYRKQIPFFQTTNFELFKLNPMIFWREVDIWYYIKDNDLKYNKLYDRGYRSIGCQPCTVPVKPEEHNRAGRWRGDDKEECGLHTEL